MNYIILKEKENQTKKCALDHLESLELTQKQWCTFLK